MNLLDPFSRQPRYFDIPKMLFSPMRLCFFLRRQKHFNVLLENAYLTYHSDGFLGARPFDRGRRNGSSTFFSRPSKRRHGIGPTNFCFQICSFSSGNQGNFLVHRKVNGHMPSNWFVCLSCFRGLNTGAWLRVHSSVTSGKQKRERPDTAQAQSPARASPRLIGEMVL